MNGTPLSFASGDTSKTFTVSTISDSDMDDETVNLAFGQLPASVVEGTHPTSQLTIEDTNSAPPTNAVPEFGSDATTTLFVPENTPAGENIGDPFTATDDDDTTLTYSLDDQDGASFEIDASGQIKTKSALDYETKDTYAVTVSVHDGRDPFGDANTAVDATIDVTINVGNIDIPDAPAEPTVTPTPGAAAGLTVSWTAVTATETAPVDGYDRAVPEEGRYSPCGLVPALPLPAQRPLSPAWNTVQPMRWRSVQRTARVKAIGLPPAKAPSLAHCWT